MPLVCSLSICLPWVILGYDTVNLPTVDLVSWSNMNLMHLISVGLPTMGLPAVGQVGRPDVNLWGWSDVDYMDKIS